MASTVKFAQLIERPAEGNRITGVPGDVFCLVGNDVNHTPSGTIFCTFPNPIKATYVMRRWWKALSSLERHRLRNITADRICYEIIQELNRPSFVGPYGRYIDREVE